MEHLSECPEYGQNRIDPEECDFCLREIAEEAYQDRTYEKMREEERQK